MGGQRHAPAALPQGMTRYPLYRRLGGSQGRSGRVRKISLPPGFDPRAVKYVASRYTDYAIPAQEVKQMWPNLKWYLRSSLEVLRETMKNLSQNSRILDQNFIPGHPGYKAGLVTTTSQCSVTQKAKTNFM